MKRIVVIALLSFVSLAIFAQTKSFEGTLTYKVDVKSKDKDRTDRAMKRLLALGDSVTVSIKEGNYRETSDVSDIYFINKKQRAYLRFTGIDTLYYMDYAFDTSTVTNISRAGDEKTIIGYACKPITISTASVVRKYYYAPSFYLNPAYFVSNNIGRFDVYAKETSSMYLALSDEAEVYSASETCTRIQPSSVNDNVFELPSLPEKKYSADAIIKPPEYTGASGWLRYLQTHINGDLGAKYLKIPKRETTATQTVLVGFVVNENGRITNVQVLNKDEVHPKLAEEAMRVVSASPSWKPASVFGEKIKYFNKQPITFSLSKQ